MALTWDYIMDKDVSEIYSEDVTDLYNGLIEVSTIILTKNIMIANNFLIVLMFKLLKVHAG